MDTAEDSDGRLCLPHAKNPACPGKARLLLRTACEGAADYLENCAKMDGWAARSPSVRITAK